MSELQKPAQATRRILIEVEAPASKVAEGDALEKSKRQLSTFLKAAGIKVLRVEVQG
jgi:predicted deacylase